MIEEHTTITKKEESKAFNVSVRAWGFLIIITTVCIMSTLGRKIEEPLYTMAGMIIAYYYAQKEPSKANANKQ